jgi:hypothetical protein
MQDGVSDPAFTDFKVGSRIGFVFVGLPHSRASQSGVRAPRIWARQNLFRTARVKALA